jgi:hypothetical protein
MISSLECSDLEKQYFDEIDENEKNSVYTRNEECNHFEVSMKRISENFKFKKYFLTIECKICNTPLKKLLTKNKDSLSYYCKKCNKPQICIHFSYENTMVMDEESYVLKDENKINIEESCSNRSTECNSQIRNNEKIFSTPPSQIQDEPKIKIYSTPEDQTQIKKSEKVKIKEYYTPVPVTKKIYKTPEQKEIAIKFKYNSFKKEVLLNELESLERQFKNIKEAFNINKEENINIYDNSDLIDIKKSPKELKWNPGMEIEIDINDN